MSQPTSTQLASKEGRMALANNSYKSGYFTSVREAAITYDIPKSTFQTRLQGRPSRQEYRSVNCKLTDTEESVLVDWILSMDERGLPVRTASIRDMATLLLQKRTNTNASSTRTIGVRWPYNFIQRHDSLRTRIIENTTTNVLCAKILQLFEIGSDSYEIRLQNMGSKIWIFITLMRRAFKWV